jgi:large subunit ribosomal protein L6
MSRVGKHEIIVPSSIALKVEGNRLEFSSKSVTRFYNASEELLLERTENGIRLTPLSKTRFARSIWGTTQRNISNIVHGLDKGFSKTLELVGVGYRAAVAGRVLTLQLGYSHDVTCDIPEGITIKCEKPTTIVVSGHDNQQIGQLCALIRSYRRPEPYKGKGIHRAGDYVVRKEGKKK